MAAAREKGSSDKREKEITQFYSNSKARRRRRHKKSLNKMSKRELMPQPIGDASHCGWFWQNYYNALEWSERHQIAYWRSRSVALEYENILLHQYVQSVLNRENNVTKNNNPSTALNKRKRYFRRKRQPQRVQEVASESDDNEDDKFEFQVNEEMMQFFEKSIRHKMEREKQREKERKQASSENESDIAPPEKQVGMERLEDMHRIYGKAAPMIIGMETAMQLTFDRNCDVHQPKLWPNIPLNI